MLIRCFFLMSITFFCFVAGSTDEAYECMQYQKFYQNAWPCDCNQITSEKDLNSCVQAAKQSESEQLQKNCKSDYCLPYVLTTTTGCPDTVQAKRVCPAICHNISDYMNREEEEVKFQAIESELPNRAQCIQESKTRVLNAYRENCVSTLTEIEQGKGESVKLLCGGNATRDNSQCDQYCIEKAEKFYGPDLDSQYIVNRFFQTRSTKARTMMGLEPSNQVLNSYYMLTKDDTVVSRLVKGDVNKVINDLFQQDGELTRKAESAGLQWWQCRRDENMECEANVKLTLETAVTVCSELQTEALECCHEPEQCVGGALAHTLDGLVGQPVL